MSETSPRPWSSDGYGDITDGKGRPLLVSGVTMPCGNHPRAAEAAANSALIVRAVNAHETVLLELATAVAYLDSLGEMDPADPEAQMREGLRAALAAAKGEER